MFFVSELSYFCYGKLSYLRVNSKSLSKRDGFSSSNHFNSECHVVADLGDAASTRFLTISNIFTHVLENDVAFIKDSFVFSAYHECQSTCSSCSNTSTDRSIDVSLVSLFSFFSDGLRRME